MRIRRALSLLLAVVAGLSGRADAQEPAWRQAAPGWRYEFPRDHGAHPDFKTEWWYFTGNVRDAATGRAYGYELTFFRQGVTPPAAPRAGASRFAVSDFKFAHFAITEIDGRRFHYDSKLARGAFGEAGFAEAARPGERLAWIDDWQLTPQADGAWRIEARTKTLALDLLIRPTKPPVIHGVDGASVKSAATGSASHYYSFTRLETRGRLSVEGRSAEVAGLSWFDHEWASGQLDPGQVGWDWFALQFEDGSELMLYALRRREGGIDAASSGTLVEANGQTRHLTRGEIEFTPRRSWASPRTKGRYPVEWSVRLPTLELELQITPTLDAQELALGPISYWEGAIRVTGMRRGQPVRGSGYLELTGYAGELKSLR
ncbi:MAG: carotenoid 1,2-hydratase [Verrucomicrobia bacterium]|nr:carotenoid 1,2-hydratase [Verrucomicrobiota bacterium]